MPEAVAIVGFDGYFVNDQGQLFSTRRGGWYQLAPQLDQDGYLHVVLRRDGRSHTVKVQRIVAAAFLGPTPAGMVICHRNGVRHDNRVSNLRFDTQRNNIADIKVHGTENPPKGETNGMARLSESDVLQIRQLYRVEGLTAVEISRRFGMSGRQIRDICNGKAWKHLQ
jgi:hypothetical protein